ncbi:MAG: MBL fold metallo-hydrolase [Christensenellaceae bacterium]
MLLTVLGKYGPYPKAGGGTSSYLLFSGDKKILLDAGSGCLSRLQTHIRPDDLDMIFLSHLHWDHCAEMFIMSYALDGNKIDAYLPKSPMGLYAMLENTGKFNVRVVDDFLKLKRDDIHVSFCRMEHPVETYAIRLQDGDAVFVYSGDSVYTEKLAEFAKGADVLLIDSGFMGPPDPEKKRPHMTVTEAAEIARQAGVKQLFLTHINPSYNEEMLFLEAARVFENTLVVQENLQYEF